jgi:3D (Asp-Asp-Asp) domain-containing protein
MRTRHGRLLQAVAVLTAVSVLAPGALAKKKKAPKPGTYHRFVATAYCQKGITKSGKRTRRGIVAADPRVLPLGSRIRVYDAAGYSGEYEVLDTGSKVKGRHIDIFVPRRREALEFGRRQVVIEVLRYGGRREEYAEAGAGAGEFACQPAPLPGTPSDGTACFTRAHDGPAAEG